MSTNSPMFSLASALVGAGAYPHEEQAAAMAAMPLPAQAVADIQHARVEIYCGHNAQAVADIRHASQQLRASSAAVPAETLAALEEAAWLTRHDDYQRAEQALDVALAHIGPHLGPQ